MAFSRGNSTRIMMGALNLSCEVRQASTSTAAELLETTTLCDSGKTYIGGMSSGSFSADGPMDTSSSTNEPYDIMSGWTGTAVPLTYGQQGLDPGDSAWVMAGTRSSYDTSASAAGLAEFSISAEISGEVGIGYSLGLETLTASADGDAVDMGAAGTSGAVVQLHVSSWDGLTTDDILVEQSADGSTGWTTLATFTQVTGVTSERIVTTGAVGRYLRATDTIVGSGTVIRCVAAATL